jgi:hypothetical protein
MLKQSTGLSVAGKGNIGGSGSRTRRQAPSVNEKTIRREVRKVDTQEANVSKQVFVLVITYEHTFERNSAIELR